MAFSLSASTSRLVASARTTQGERPKRTSGQDCPQVEGHTQRTAWCTARDACARRLCAFHACTGMTRASRRPAVRAMASKVDFVKATVDSASVVVFSKT